MKTKPAVAKLKSNKREIKVKFINRIKADLHNDERTVHKESRIITSMYKLDNLAWNYKKQNQPNHNEKWKNLQSWLNNFKNLDQEQRDETKTKISKDKLYLAYNIKSYCT